MYNMVYRILITKNKKKAASVRTCRYSIKIGKNSYLDKILPSELSKYKTGIFSIVYCTIYHDKTKYLGYGNSPSNRKASELFFNNIVRTTQRDNPTLRWKSKCWENYFDPPIPRAAGIVQTNVSIGVYVREKNESKFG